MRRAIGPYAVLLRLALGMATPCASAFALDPALDASQYVHTSWRVRDGFGKGAIRAIAQTPDGYLWLGSEYGLLRFDGVRTVPWPEVTGHDLPIGNDVYRLLVARDGALWIGTSKGLARWSEGRLTSYPELTDYYVFALLEDREGAVWVGALGIPTGKLCAIRSGGVQCHGEDGRLGRIVADLYEDRRGNLWAGGINGMWRWSPGPPQFYELPDRHTTNGFAEDEDGALLVGGQGGVVRFAGGKAEAYSPPGVAPDLNALRMRRDRNGALWIGSANHGLVHVHAGTADSFTHLDGLSGDFVSAFLEDREGSLWVATDAGLDRFRDPAVTTFSESQGLSRAGVYSVLATKDGSVWFASGGGLNRLVDGRITIPRIGRDTPDGKSDGLIPIGLFEDSGGRLWVTTTAREMGYLENERFTAIRGVPAGFVRAMAEDTAGTLWIANQEGGLVGVSGGKVVQQIPWTRLGHTDFATALLADRAGGGLWAGFFRGGIAYVRDGQVRASYGAAEGLGAGNVAAFRLEADGTLWIATEGGLSHLKDGRLATLTRRNGLPCDDVHWVMEDDARSFWLDTACGLVRIERSEIHAWAAAQGVDRAGPANAARWIRATAFDLSDGVRSYPGIRGNGQSVTKSSDGRLWFLASSEGVSVLDPRHLALNPLPPPVHIEQITADRKAYDPSLAAGGRLRLPALSRDLQIDYTALSLAAPEKVRFRYKLEGRDRDWQDAGTRRQAFYTDLRPGNYRFRMTASNNSGVWNEAGTFVDFSVAPAYYQTAWFRLAGVAAFAGLLAALYRLRLRQVTRQVRMRMEVRLEERERIARDLHDTLLQGVQGLILKFGAIAKRIPAEDATRRAIDETLDRANSVLAEGRDSVQSLRTGAPVRDLPSALERVVKDASLDGATRFKSVVEGRPRELDPIVLEESVSIGREALLNAFAHSGGAHVEMEIAYDPRQFRMRIRDDGRGIDPDILGKGGRSGHWGIQGMRERALRIGARLELWSRPDGGTEVELTVPAATAYRGPGTKAATSWSGPAAGPS